MPSYRRWSMPGGTFFLTVVTYCRRPTFSDPEQVSRLRLTLREVMREAPFRIVAGVVLPDHVHFLWTLPRGDGDFSSRVGRMKARFTRSSGRAAAGADVSRSRRRHREADVWQRRFWEHTILDEVDLERHADDIHYNPVRHGLVTCPHLWPHSSFSRWVRSGHYPNEWGCRCAGRRPADDWCVMDVAGE
ncbi:MAG: transposase [Isosphaeraceae bacterium]